MSKSNDCRKKKLNPSLIFGVFSLSIGLCLLFYSISMANEFEVFENNINLMFEELRHFNGSEQWWLNASIFLFIPLTGVFFSLGGFFLCSRTIEKSCYWIKSRKLLGKLSVRIFKKIKLS